VTTLQAVTSRPRPFARLAAEPAALDVDIAGVRRAVLAWFEQHGRSLPFRGTRDPYLVLVSETLLQQTQISRGGPAWVRFTAQFPTIESLAAATPATVLRAWQGLGYNRRAINLQRAARIVVEELGGALPRDVEGLQRLPGVGPYTARAVASIAYRLPIGAVDTNVRRVLGRVLTGDQGGLAARELQAAADELVDPEQPDDWTHALMDIGSTLCRPLRPRCAECPVARLCRYAAGDRPAGVPRRSARDYARQGGPAEDFQATTRWLRGRILDRLREAHEEAWTSFPEPIGGHDLAAIATSLRAMERDGLLELDVAGPVRAGAAATPAPRARLPIA
jgi:A/G-specific adenine glycosylase